MTILGVSITAEAFEFRCNGADYVMMNVPESFPHVVAMLEELPLAPHIICEEADGWNAVARYLVQAGFRVSLASQDDVCAFGNLASVMEISPEILESFAVCHPQRLRTPRLPRLRPAARMQPATARLISFVRRLIPRAFKRFR